MTEIKVGMMVRVNRQPSRTSRVVEIRANLIGTPVYVLADGGWLYASEITPEKYQYEAKPYEAKRYYCTVCKQAEVAALDGEDTCPDCLRNI